MAIRRENRIGGAGERMLYSYRDPCGENIRKLLPCAKREHIRAQGVKMMNEMVDRMSDDEVDEVVEGIFSWVMWHERDCTWRGWMLVPDRIPG